MWSIFKPIQSFAYAFAAYCMFNLFYWSESGHLTFDPVSRLIACKAGFASVATADFVMLQWPIQSYIAPPGSKPTMTEAMTVAVPYPVGSEFATALEF